MWVWICTCPYVRACAFVRVFVRASVGARVRLLHTPALFHTIDVHGNRLTAHILSSSQNQCHSHEKNEECGAAGAFSCRVRVRAACRLRAGYVHVDTDILSRARACYVRAQGLAQTFPRALTFAHKLKELS